MTMTRRSLFGLALAPLAPVSAGVSPTEFNRACRLAAAHRVAEPAMLITDMNGGPIMKPMPPSQDRAWCGCNREERRNADCPCWQRLESYRPGEPAGAEKAGGA